MAERMERAWRAYPEVQEKVPRPPSAILRDHCYLDTVLFNPSAIRLAAELVGPERLLLGSDYPHQVGDLPGCQGAVAAAGFSASATAGILGGNAARLLRIA